MIFESISDQKVTLIDITSVKYPAKAYIPSLCLNVNISMTMKGKIKI